MSRLCLGKVPAEPGILGVQEKLVETCVFDVCANSHIVPNSYFANLPGDLLLYASSDRMSIAQDIGFPEAQNRVSSSA